MDLAGTFSDLATIGWEARPGRLGRQAHVAAGLARAMALSMHNQAVSRFVWPFPPLAPTAAEDRVLRRRAIELFDTDWRNVEAGVYPASLARGFSWLDLARLYPRLVLDAPNVRRRARNNVHDELPPEAANYPSYYRRNFHFQSEGYFGRHSAEVYDAQVELLFGGTADAMRRQVLPPLVRELRRREPSTVRVLDVACGTGHLLAMIAQALPGVPLWGLDLSPHYVARARRELEVVPLSLVVENAEDMPFVDGYFDAVTSVYLAHEVPPDVRSRIFSEVARVLKPGGLFVFEDSIQLSDSPELRRHLEYFPRQFHEPYYRGYVRDDLQARLAGAGLAVERSEVHFVSKVLVARKPATA